MLKREFLLFIILIALLSFQHARAQFTIADQRRVTSIVYDIQNSALDSIVAHLLAKDIEAVTNRRPQIYTTLDGIEGNVIVIGDVSSDLINRYFDTTRLIGKWETYGRVFIDAPAERIDKAMFIVGSDPRGAAYGVFDLSEQIGVSPWYWWADVPIKKKEILLVNSTDTLSGTPSVKYRGIFINDEGWGLEPWASKTFEPEVGNMGPKTYARIFELLLRLKGNAVWPGMHPNTRPFFNVPGNAEKADQWEIEVGTSHAEPMLRNNVGEWNSQTRGSFNYQSNASSVYKYWEERVQESQGINAIYTVGMRGIHDSGMQGFDSNEEKADALEKIIDDQRELLSKYINDDVTKVPQSFTPYKEVLEIYESGMDVPEDITIVWPDDNHGNIKHFSNEAERQRSGGAGVYYHLSYLGAPHPYIWLSPASPGLVWREMTRAWLNNMNQIWIGNVGDIKRREWQMEFFLNLAWDINAWTPKNIRGYFENVASRDISEKYSMQIADMMWEYYRLATERKPEFMGFNEPQWNGWTPTQDPLYNLWHYNDEVEERINRYQELQAKAKQIMQEIPQESRDTYFQLVYYPIAGATAINEKWLYAYKSREYAKQGRAVANSLSDSAFSAFRNIIELTQHYNQEVANGKWEHIVKYSPSYKKGSLVFWEPITKRIETEGLRGLGVAIEGQPEPLNPIRGNLPDITTRESKITLSVSDAKIFEEMERAKDAEGEFVTWSDIGIERQISEPLWDKIPFEIESSTKAVFEFNFEGDPGGVHTLNLSVNHPDEDSDSWWVTLNDRPPYKAGDSVGRIEKLRAGDFVLKPGLNKLTIHPREDGAKLYGIEFVQKSIQASPIYSDENQLPEFSRHSDQRHFIDIFSRGQEKESWSAKTSAPWIELSKDEGKLEGSQDRIWVNVNFDKAPSEKDLAGQIEITNGKQYYRVVVSAINQQLSAESGTFAETNGVITIPANQYSKKQVGKTASWNSLTGLGRSGSAMILQPMNGWYIEDLTMISEESPVLEYELVVTKGGKANLIVEAVPAFALVLSQQLRCAISIDEDKPQWVNFEMSGRQWDDNVLENRMIGMGQVSMEPGTYKLKLWGTDPSVNVDRILIDFGGLKKSYTGPSATRIGEN